MVANSAGPSPLVLTVLTTRTHVLAVPLAPTRAPPCRRRLCRRAPSRTHALSHAALPSRKHPVSCWPRLTPLAQSPCMECIPMLRRKRLPKLSTYQGGRRPSPQHGCPVRTASGRSQLHVPAPAPVLLPLRLSAPPAPRTHTRRHLDVQVDARTPICDARPPRDDTLHSQRLGAPIGPRHGVRLAPLAARIGDHGRSRQRARSAAAGFELRPQLVCVCPPHAPVLPSLA